MSKSRLDGLYAVAEDSHIQRYDCDFGFDAHEWDCSKSASHKSSSVTNRSQADQIFRFFLGGEDSTSSGKCPAKVVRHTNRAPPPDQGHNTYLATSSPRIQFLSVHNLGEALLNLDLVNDVDLVVAHDAHTQKLT